jgi:hypothetical protein
MHTFPCSCRRHEHRRRRSASWGSGTRRRYAGSVVAGRRVQPGTRPSQGRPRAVPVLEGPPGRGVPPAPVHPRRLDDVGADVRIGLGRKCCRAHPHAAGPEGVRNFRRSESGDDHRPCLSFTRRHRFDRSLMAVHQGSLAIKTPSGQGPFLAGTPEVVANSMTADQTVAVDGHLSPSTGSAAAMGRVHRARPPPPAFTRRTRR